jgi:hypothetical protein
MKRLAARARRHQKIPDGTGTMRTRFKTSLTRGVLGRRTPAPLVLAAALSCAAAWGCQSTATPSPETKGAALGVPTASAQELPKSAQELPKTAQELPKSAAAPVAEATKPGDAKKPAEPPKAAEAPASKGGDAKLTQGAVASDEAFSTWLQAESPAKAGGPITVEAVLTAKPPYHCNAEYPHKFKLNAAPAGLSYPEETVRGMKVTPERSVLAIPVKAEAAGKPTISGTLSFSVCTAERCMVEKRDLSLALDVK